MLDLVLGGGWGRGRVVNVVGDSSSGKTLLAIEACANYTTMFPSSRVRYVDSEHAFDETYAQSLGMPPTVQTIDTIETVEQFFDDLQAFIKKLKGNTPSLYVLDSLDALSDAAEMDRNMTEGSYGVNKAKLLSQMFRRSVGPLQNANCTLMVISQLRDKIGVVFGERHTRAGGRALQFYSSQVVWLREIKKIKQTILGDDRVVGVEILARNRKNKMGLPFREAEMTIMFGFGVDDCVSMIKWLKDAKVLAIGSMSMDACTKAYKEAMQEGDKASLTTINQALRRTVLDRWNRIEDAVRPTMSKYGV
jgi:recombination protein RecA